MPPLAFPTGGGMPGSINLIELEVQVIPVYPMSRAWKIIGNII